MKQLLSLFAAICFFCVSCNKETVELEEPDESGIVQVSVYYCTKDNPNIEMLDLNSRLFIYYGYDNYFFDFEGFSFHDGVLTKGEETISPDESALIENGKLTFHLERIDEPFTMIIESRYYRRITAESYISGKKKVDFTVIFGPY